MKQEKQNGNSKKIVMITTPMGNGYFFKQYGDFINQVYEDVEKAKNSNKKHKTIELFGVTVVKDNGDLE